MRRVIMTTGLLIVLAAIGGAAFIYSGGYDVGADAPHWPATYRVLQAVRDRSIQAHAAQIHAPVDLVADKRIAAGAAHVREHCALCHGAPGVQPDDLADGMYPKPPDLTHVASRLSPPELFWILKHGIKMSGMPSWADHGDNELWNIVGFLEALPTMRPARYQELVAAAQAMGGHHGHDGGGDESAIGMESDDHATPPSGSHE